MNKLKSIPSIIFLVLAILIGGYIRLSQVIHLDYPINDGGLFYAMTSDLQANHYHLPATTSYNGFIIPFAYPPLGLYLTGYLSDATGWSLLDIFRLLPAVLSILCIPAFYLLARELIDSEYRLSLSILAFALLPATFDWLVMGGGITRASGFLFLILTLASLYLMYSRQSIRFIFLTAILATATILSHPEAALHLFTSVLVFWWFFARNKKGTIHSIIIGGLTLLFSSPWWLNILIKSGMTPFMNAGSTGWFNLGEVFSFLEFNITHEINLQSMGVLALIGIFISIARRKYFAPIWMLVIFISEPRSAPLYLTPVLCIFISMALEEILTRLSNLEKKEPLQSSNGQMFSGIIARITFGILMGQWVVSSFLIIRNEANTMTLTKADGLAYSWIQTHTPTESNFLVITGMQPLSDPVSEWFPALTGRNSVGTVQGREWIHSQNFEEVLNKTMDIQQCSSQSMACISKWLAGGGTPFEYVYLRKLQPVSYFQIDVIDSGLLDSMLASRQYDLIYDTPEISILRSLHN